MKRYLDFITIIIVLVVGILIGRWLFPKEEIVFKDSPTPTPIVITVQGEDKTIIKYIPKEINPQTGEKEKTDIQLDTDKTQINVKINDKEFSITPEFQEDYKFENGKIMFEQQSNFNLFLDLPKPERKIELGGYLSLDGFGGTIVVPKNSQNNGSYIIMGGPHYDFKGWDALLSITY